MTIQSYCDTREQGKHEKAYLWDLTVFFLFIFFPIHLNLLRICITFYVPILMNTNISSHHNVYEIPIRDCLTYDVAIVACTQASPRISTRFFFSVYTCIQCNQYYIAVGHIVKWINYVKCLRQLLHKKVQLIGPEKKEIEFWNEQL